MIIDLTFQKSKYKKDSELSIVVPVYNEEDNILKVVREWSEIFNEMEISYVFILVNDGSKDKSLELIKSIELDLVVLNKYNSGHGRSLRYGYDFSVQKTKSKYTLQIDSDGQCRPEHFKTFWDSRKKYHAIIGKRKNRKDGFFRLITTKLARNLSSLIVKEKLIDPNTPYRLIENQTLSKCLTYIPESFDIHNIALTYILKKQKFTTFHPEISFPDRFGGSNSINIARVVQMGLSLLFDLYFLKKIK